METYQSMKDSRLKFSFWGMLLIFLYPTLFLFVSIYCFYDYNGSRHFFPRQDNSPVFANSLFFFLFLLSIYGFYNTKRYFKTTAILSKLSIEFKEEIIRDIKASLKLYEFKQVERNEFLLFSGGKWYFRMWLNITIFTDEFGFYINVTETGADWPFDFGYVNHFQKKIIKEIELRLVR